MDYLPNPLEVPNYALDTAKGEEKVRISGLLIEWRTTRGQRRNFFWRGTELRFTLVHSPALDRPHVCICRRLMSVTPAGARRVQPRRANPRFGVQVGRRKIRPAHVHALVSGEYIAVDYTA